MFELVEAFLCHNITANVEPIVLKPKFYESDPFVVIFLCLRIPEPIDIRLTYLWDHESGFRTSSEKIISQMTGQIRTYAYISPVLIKATKSVNPSGQWRLRVFAGPECFIDLKFSIEGTPWLNQSVFFDSYA